MARRADRAPRPRQDRARRHAAHRAALRRPAHRGRGHDGARAARLRAAQARRARRRRPVLPLALGADDRLQGHAHLRAAARVLSRPARPGLRVRPGARALALLDQHVPQLAAGAPVPLRLPQRRDQHGAGQPQLDARSRGAAVDVVDRGRPVAHLPDLHAGRERLGQLRRGARAPAPRRALATARRAHDDPRGVGEPLPHGPRAARLLPLPRLAHGAVGRPGRHLVHRRDRGGSRARPQWPAPVALLGHRRRTRRAGQRGRRARHRTRARRAQGPPATGPHVPRRHVQGSPRRGRGDQGRAGVGAPLRAVAVDRPGPPRRAPGPHDAHAPARARRDPTARVRLHQRGAARHRGADGALGDRAARLHGFRHRHRRPVGPLPAPLRLLHPAVRAGDEPAARRPARGAGDVAGRHDRARGQPARRRAVGRAARSSCRCR